MSIRAGQILSVMNTFVVDRIQTGGPGNLNIPTERVNELGNFQSVGIVRDVPDLTFTLDKLSVDTEVEGLLTGSADPAADPMGTDPTNGTKYTLANTVPIDIVSPWKSAQGAFDAVRGVAIPHLTLESASYRYGLRENAGETFSLRGDSIFYIPGTPYNEVFTADGVATTFAFTNGPALLYTEQGVGTYALNVSVDGVRQTRGTDYTEDAAGVTFTTAPANGAIVRVTYGSATATTYPQTVHQGTTVKPAAIRGRDIQVFVGVEAAAPFRWDGVQSVNLDYRVTLEDDFEFGNARAVARDYSDVPAVTGSIELKPVSIANLFDKIRRITGVPAADIVGPFSSVAVPLEIRLLNPESAGSDAQAVGQVLKTLYVPDARFTLPGYEGRVQQKLVTTVNFAGDTGVLEVNKGPRQV